MTNKVEEWKQRVIDTEERNRQLEMYIEHLESKLESFKTGKVPENATLDHMILAKYGKIRLEEKRKTAALLSSKQQG